MAETHGRTMIHFINKVMTGVEWILVACLGVMVTLVFGNVVLRYVFDTGIVISEEMSRFLFVYITLIGALVVMRHNGHLGMSSVIALFGERGRRVCRFVADVLTLGCCLLLVHGSWKQVRLGMDDLAPVTGIPLGLIQASLLIASVGMSLALAWSLWRQLTGRMPKEELIPFGEEA
jgi:TRAP-type transport system small permease protein